MRTKHQIFALTGHASTVGTLFTQSSEFQLTSGSHDSTIKLWDIRAGKCKGTLTHHKKSVRALSLHPNETTFASGSPQQIKQWVMHKENGKAEFPNVRFVQNFTGQQGIVNCLSANHDNVLFSGGDNGSMHFWDWRTGHCFQSLSTTVQPGSLDSEAGIFASTFDQTGSRLITCEADKTIKIWKEDDSATPETHPVNWRPELKRTRY
jgi:pleiotropic regulator 1